MADKWVNHLVSDLFFFCFFSRGVGEVRNFRGEVKILPWACEGSIFGQVHLI